MAFLIRFTHLGAVSFLFGGALLLFVLLLQRRRASEPFAVALRQLLQSYELAFWVGVGLVVATGVGNLGNMAPGVPGPNSEWGRELTTKLALVLVLLLFSAVRTLTLVRVVAAEGVEQGIAGGDRLLALYGATAVLLAGIMAFGVALAHF